MKQLMMGCAVAACRLLRVASVRAARAELLLVVAVLLAAGCARDVEPVSRRNLVAVQGKPAVVMVTAGYLVNVKGKASTFLGGHGSGFFIDPDGYVATNAHVVELVQMGEEKAQTQVLEQYVTQLNPALLTRPRSEFRGAVEDLRPYVTLSKKANVILADGQELAYDIKAYGTPFAGEAGSKDVAILKVQLENAPTLRLAGSGAAQLQDPVYAIGYPGTTNELQAWLEAKTTLDPRVTDGAISSLLRAGDGVPLIQVTTQISRGNSGGPALNERGEVVGLATFGATSAPGNNYLVAASTVHEFIRQSGAGNRNSPVNDLFAEALTLYGELHCSDAIERLEHVLQLFPAHVEAGKLLRQAQLCKREGREARSALALMFGGAGVLVPLGAAGFLWWRRRRGGRRPRRVLRTELVNDARDGATIAIDSGQRASLRFLTGPLGGQVLPVGTGGIVGRESRDAAIVVPDPQVSSRHAWIGTSDGALVFMDRGSTNGSAINDQPVKAGKKVPLRHGDVIALGKGGAVRLVVELA